jgi:hypothetical protein
MSTAPGRIMGKPSVKALRKRLSGRVADSAPGMREERTATRPTELLKSIDIEIVPGCNLAFIELANFFQHLLFATSIAALLCARLVTAGVAAGYSTRWCGLALFAISASCLVEV